MNINTTNPTPLQQSLSSAFVGFEDTPYTEVPLTPLQQSLLSGFVVPLEAKTIDIINKVHNLASRIFGTSNANPNANYHTSELTGSLNGRKITVLSRT